MQPSLPQLHRVQYEPQCNQCRLLKGSERRRPCFQAKCSMTTAFRPLSPAFKNRSAVLSLLLPNCSDWWYFLQLLKRLKVSVQMLLFTIQKALLVKSHFLWDFHGLQSPESCKSHFYILCKDFGKKISLDVVPSFCVMTDINCKIVLLEPTAIEPHCLNNFNLVKSQTLGSKHQRRRCLEENFASVANC